MSIIFHYRNENMENYYFEEKYRNYSVFLT